MPIVPGVILIESMAQTAGIVVSKKYEKYEDKSVLFMSVSKAKFRKPVYPNEKFIFMLNFLIMLNQFINFLEKHLKIILKYVNQNFLQ